MAAALDTVRNTTRRWIRAATRAAGGRKRFRIVVLLAATLALDAADQGSVGAIAPDLHRALHIDNTQLGLLVTVVSLTGAFATIPAGALADRVNRTRFLAGAIALWGIAQAAAGAAGSYPALLVARLGLGVVVAVAGPTVASLTGDYFAPGERGRIYGMILVGELVGTGIGLLVAGEITAVLSWRWALWVLAAPAVVLAWQVWRMPEPERGESNRSRRATPTREAARSNVRQAIRRSKVRPRRAAVLRTDPERLPLWRAVVYVLRVRSNLVFIVAGALGYFFLAGVRTFALLYIRGRYDLAQSTATLLVLAIGAGSVVGVVIGGRLGDRLIAHGRLAGRVVVAAAGYVAAAIILGPAIATGILGVSLPLYVLAGVALAAPNPPLDAARLDVIHHRVWGRAEGVRQFLRALAESGAPLLFGFTADHLLGGGSRGLEYAFLIMLVPLLASGALLFLTRGSYMRDVASAVESERRAA